MSENLKKEIPDIPTIFVIFGITGDLARRKLIPALLDLYGKGFLPKRFSLVGFSRRTFSEEEFKNLLREYINDKNHSYNEKLVEEFIENSSYLQGFFDSEDGYKSLQKRLEEIDIGFGQCSNKLFYLAVPPSQYETIFKGIGKSELNKPCDDNTGWTRILVEKPFGNNTDTAIKLDKMLGKIFDEEQIFRIDHYLAKEALQNIMVFRFANGMFEPIWNRNHINSVHILFHEAEGLRTRGAFYDSVGLLRDVGQNHMLAMLSHVAMEEPKFLTAYYVRPERAKVLGALKKIKSSAIENQVIRGQYEGFQGEEGVAEGSETETFFSLKAYINNSRWRGVPFYMKSGKGLGNEKMEINVHFGMRNQRELSKYDCKGGCKCNVLTFRIQPNEGISISFWVKRPGFENEVESKRLNFSYEESGFGSMIPDAYERVLFDCIIGEQTLFSSTDEVKNSWKFITPILERWTKTPLHKYKKGSDGPVSKLF
ncbi:MAG: glucose-6-phosphate dehydrogenase [Parcubacteria group bacterium CG11_big_fil_rev_8_21_14_0_20_39_22]|nr:MAG: glucose-6-phosphate dehydrogenase [Parcubacteria group bacterium CG11_big_fil_rev_8_21_14_0_20_39_22]